MQRGKCRSRIGRLEWILAMIEEVANAWKLRWKKKVTCVNKLMWSITLLDSILAV